MKTSLLRMVYLGFAFALSASAQAGVCRPVGGSLITNLGAVNAATSLGPVAGDLAGAVTGTILGQSVDSDGKIVLRVQHHWVTEAGDNILFDEAVAKNVQVTPTLATPTEYSARIVGGTGKFDGARGELSFIGAADFATARTTLRYSGKICFRN